MADSEVQKLIIWVGSQEKINQAREQGLIGNDDFTCVTGLPEFALQSEVRAIQVLIPSAATTQNQLADKDFVNSSINNMAAFYVTSDVQGDPFATRTDLLAGPWYNQGVERTPTQNDYALVTEDETHDYLTSRYMYDGTQWVWQYTLNNTKFTQAQIDAINSGITAALVSQITTNQNNIGDLSSLQTSTKTSTVAAINELQTGKQATINDLSDIRSNASAGKTASETIATYGNIVTHSVNEFATAAQGTKADTAVQPGDLGSAALAETSDFATAAQGTLAESALQPNDNLSELNNDAGFITISALNGYQLEATIQTLSATDSITLADNTIYNGGEQTSLTITLPSTDTIGFICNVDFTSGATATTLSYSLSDIFWKGVDVAYDSTAQKNIFTPVANKRYTIIFYYDGVNYNGRVGGV